MDVNLWRGSRRSGHPEGTQLQAAETLSPGLELEAWAPGQLGLRCDCASLLGQASLALLPGERAFVCVLPLRTDGPWPGAAGPGRGARDCQLRRKPQATGLMAVLWVVGGAGEASALDPAGEAGWVDSWGSVTEKPRKRRQSQALENLERKVESVSPKKLPSGRGGTLWTWLCRRSLACGSWGGLGSWGASAAGLHLGSRFLPGLLLHLRS